MSSARRWIAALGIAALLALLAVPAWAGPAEQTVPAGAVVALQGTPHLWIADEQGILHWAGDTRALAGRAITWSDWREVSLDQLRGYRRGDPYLSAGLLKIGDPIYLVKWETNQAAPTLLHIQSIADVEIFGINADNYGRFVFDKAGWEQRFGMSADPLARAVLAPAVPPTPTPTPAATATPSVRMVARLEGLNRIDADRFQTVILITGALPRTRFTVSAVTKEYNCMSGCTQEDGTVDRSWGPIEAGVSDANGRLTFVDEHGPYKSYTYTFRDQFNNTVSISVGDDLAPR
jgi:hypothetical protein